MSNNSKKQGSTQPAAEKRRAVSSTFIESDSDDSELDDDLETAPEQATVYPPPQPIEFQLTYVSDQEEDEPLSTDTLINPPSSLPPLHLKSHDLLQRCAIFPPSTLTLHHQLTALTHYVHTHHPTPHHVSYSAPSGASLLYTDAHAPYITSDRESPLTIWFIHPPHLLQVDKLCELISNKLNLIHITIDVLLKHAKEYKFHEYELFQQTLIEGFTLSSKQVYALFLFFLNTNQAILENGYILSSNLQISMLDFQNLSSLIDMKSSSSSSSSSSSVSVSSSVWPPRYLFDLTSQLRSSDIVHQYAQHKKLALFAQYADATSNGLQDANNSLDDDVAASDDDFGTSGGGGGNGSNNDDDAANNNSSRPSSPSLSKSASATLFNKENIAKLTNIDLSKELTSLKTYEMIENDLVAYENDYKYLHHFIQLFPQSQCNYIPLDGTSSSSSLFQLVLYSLGQALYHPQPTLLSIQQELKPLEEDDVRELLIVNNNNNANANNTGSNEYETEVLNDPLVAQQSNITEKFGIYQTFCPVTLHNENRLAEGSEEFTVSYKGNVYMMSNQANYVEFLRAPQRFLSQPPCLPANYTVLILGSNKIGKTTIANYFKNNYQWNVITYDNDEKTIEQLQQSKGRNVMDSGPFTQSQLEAYQQKGVKIDKIIYLYVEDVELLPARLKSAKLQIQLAAAQSGFYADGTPYVAPVVEEPKVSAPNTAREKEKAKKGKDKKEVVNNEEESPEDEELMDKADEFQNDVWPSLLPYLEEHAYNFSEINAALPIEQVSENVRCAIDPFYAYRKINAAQKITHEQLERSKDEDRFNRNAEARQLKYGDTNFCPVCLIDSQLLVPGQVGEGYLLEGQSYSLCSTACADKFLAAPQHYNLNSPAHLLSWAPQLPALRILLVGARDSAKSTAAAFLQKHYNIESSFQLSALFYPKFRQLVEQTLIQVQKLDELEKQRKAHEKEQRRLAKKQKKEAEALARLKEGGTASDEESESASESESEDEDDKDDEDQNDILKKDQDTLRMYLQSSESRIYEHTTLLQEVLDEEWFTTQQIDELFLSIFQAYHKVGNSTAPSGWICEVDIYNPYFLTRLEHIFHASHIAKPHIILPLHVSTKAAVTRAVQREMKRKESASDDMKIGLQQISEKHRLKQEAEKLRKEKELEKQRAEEEKKQSKSKRFGKDKKDKDGKDKDGKESKQKDARADDKKRDMKNKRRSLDKDGLKESEESEHDSDSNAPNLKESESTQSLKEQNAEKEKSEADLQREAEEEEKKQIARQQYEELSALMQDLYRQSVDITENLVQNLKLASFVIASQVSSNEALRLFEQKLYAALKPFLSAQSALFHTPQFISRRDAQRLLSSGMKSWPVFGSFCPVSLLNGKRFDCLQGEQDYQAVLWSHYVVYTAGAQHAQQFIDNIKLYMTQPTAPPPVAFSCAVRGAPLAGSSTLAAKLAKQFGLALLTMESVVKTVADSQPPTLLSREISTLLAEGGLISDESAVRCLAFVVNSTAARFTGWILDGFPNTIEQAQLMRCYSVKPMMIVDLKYGADAERQIMTRQKRYEHSIKRQRQQMLLESIEQVLPDGDDQPNQTDSSSDLNPALASQTIPLIPPSFPLDSTIVNPRFPLAEYADSAQIASALVAYYRRAAVNVKEFDVCKNTAWQLSDQLAADIKSVISTHQQYRIATTLPAPAGPAPALISNMNVHASFLNKHASEFRNYCPICWIDQGALRKYKKDLSFTVEYRQKYYRCCSAAHSSAFMAEPSKYLLTAPGALYTPLNLPRPPLLPFLVNQQESARINDNNVELLGYCPVTLIRSQESGDLKVVKGDPAFTVAYDRRLFRLASSVEYDEFISFPTRYSRATLPQKMPVTVPQQSAKDLLALGKTLAFMQQSLSVIIQKAMVSMEPLRQAKSIKYPGVPLSSTALLYMALYMKVHNPNNTTARTQKYQEKLNKFIKDCSLVHTVAQQLQSSPVSQEKADVLAEEEAKQNGDASPPPASKPVLSDEQLAYDTLRSEINAHVKHMGSRESLYKYFERFLR